MISCFIQKSLSLYANILLITIDYDYCCNIDNQDERNCDNSSETISTNSIPIIWTNSCRPDNFSQISGTSIVKQLMIIKLSQMFI